MSIHIFEPLCLPVWKCRAWLSIGSQHDMLPDATLWLWLKNFFTVALVCLGCCRLGGSGMLTSTHTHPAYIQICFIALTSLLITYLLTHTYTLARFPYFRRLQIGVCLPVCAVSPLMTWLMALAGFTVCCYTYYTHFIYIFTSLLPSHA